MSIFIQIGEQIALIVAFTFIYGMLKRFLDRKSKVWSEIIHGLTFAIIALAGMQIPIEVVPGVLMDARVIVID